MPRTDECYQSSDRLGENVYIIDCLDIDIRACRVLGASVIGAGTYVPARPRIGDGLALPEAYEVREGWVRGEPYNVRPGRLRERVVPGGKEEDEDPQPDGTAPAAFQTPFGRVRGGLSSTQRIMDVGSRQSVVYYSDSQAPESTFSN